MFASCIGTMKEIFDHREGSAVAAASFRATRPYLECEITLVDWWFLTRSIRWSVSKLIALARMSNWNFKIQFFVIGPQIPSATI